MRAVSEAWQRVHRRYELAEEVLRRVGRARRVDVVIDRWAPRLEEEFGDVGSFLQHVQRQWYARLAVRMDVLLDGDGPDEDPRRVWQQLCREEPAMRRLLDVHAAHPALRHGDRVNSDLVRRATGLTLDELARDTSSPRPRWGSRISCPLRRRLASRSAIAA